MIKRKIREIIKKLKYNSKSYYRNAFSYCFNSPNFPSIDFIIIGSAKCGTTSLHNYIGLHPDVYLPQNVGINNETGFFLEDSNQKIKSMTNRSIRQHLNDAALYKIIMEGYKNESLVGEETTDYTKKPHREVRYELMKKHNENMKFIFIVRDPVEKLISQYRHFLRHQSKFTNVNFTEELESDDYYKDACCYYYQVEPYIDSFGDQSVLVVFLEDLEANPNIELLKIFKFLGLAEYQVDHQKFVKHNVNTKVTKDDYDIHDIPLTMAVEIIKDLEKFSEFVDQDLFSKWPKSKILKELCS